MKKFLVLLLTVGCAIHAFAEPRKNLDKLSEKKRTEYLLKASKEAIMTYAPDWYREAGGYKIERFENEKDTDIKRYGKVFYMITRYYDEAEEIFPLQFSTEVCINEESGKVTAIGFGDGGGFGGLDHPESFTREPRKAMKPGQYKKKK